MKLAAPILALTAACIPAAAQPGPEMMDAYINAIAFDQLAKRRETYEAVKTAGDVHQYQDRLKKAMLEALGGFPEKTPLNPQITGTLERDGYRIEKILFESQPGFHVTALMYLPPGPGPHPCVLVPCGHSGNGKAYESYQRACIILARNGIAAFCFDPIGQGERHQFLDSAGKPVVEGTIDHTYHAAPTTLLGISTANIFIWDGIRALDYLVTRADIDPSRIGCAGNSGGGTQTSYLMALDHRIAAAAPNCYITSFEKLLVNNGAQDAEQHIYGQIAFGMDFGDYAILRAPKPTMFCTATRDFFDIDGAYASFRDAKRMYTRLGFAERMNFVETDDEHGWNRDLREQTARFMYRWFFGQDKVITESDAAILTDEEAWVTPKGQVLLMDGARDTAALFREMETGFAEDRKAAFANGPTAEWRDAVRALSGIRKAADLPTVEAQGPESLDALDGVQRQRWVLTPESGIGLPVVAYLPEGATALTLYLNSAGKDAAESDPRVKERIAQGHAVAAVDLRGMGETTPTSRYESWTPHFGKDWQQVFASYFIARPYVAMRTEDVLSVARFVAEFAASQGGADLPIHILAEGQAVVPALHAAALEPERFASAAFHNGTPSWSEVAVTPLVKNEIANAAYGALRLYDLPDLLAAIPEEKVAAWEPAPLALLERN